MPNFDVKCWNGYDTNQFSFYTKAQDHKSTIQNNGVMVDYTKFRVSVFKYKWVDNNVGVQPNELGFTLIDLDKVGYKGESFILASYAKQVFYVKDSSNQRWAVVLQ
ncbi:hypothetical protein CR513_56155, partial [Mucuna pruriens]